MSALSWAGLLEYIRSLKKSGGPDIRTAVMAESGAADMAESGAVDTGQYSEETAQADTNDKEEIRRSSTQEIQLTPSSLQETFIF